MVFHTSLAFTTTAIALVSLQGAAASLPLPPTNLEIGARSHLPSEPTHHDTHAPRPRQARRACFAGSGGTKASEKPKTRIMGHHGKGTKLKKKGENRYRPFHDASLALFCFRDSEAEYDDVTLSVELRRHSREQFANVIPPPLGETTSKIQLELNCC
ncbi:hypothetical protein B0H34DRAFT_791929 [Crassisporium funariophilum]|nr:hypothetical protein B0H34DRAFT_791929 [Crassisporium funariophilum]